MSFSVVEHKLRIFISSRCGGDGNKYTIARKSLKSLLESTMLIDVYVYETEPASSQDTIDSYLNYLDESNLCVFLIDNKDNASEAVLREQKRAKEKNLRLIYIFCDENEKNPTEMQNEIKKSFSEKYYIVHEFSDVVSKAYQSIMQDIIAIYKEKKPLSTISEESNAGISYKETNENEIKYEMDKDKFLKFPHTIKHIKFLTGTDNIENESTGLDSMLSSYYDLVMKRRGFDLTKHEKLTDEIIRNQSSSLSKMLFYRFKAISFYYQNDLDSALIELQNAINEAVSNPAIPNWLALDVAIDIRYIHNLIDETNSQYTKSNFGQKFINENVETVYYPLLDRKCSEYYKNLNEKYFNNFHISPYTIQIKDHTRILSYIGEAFCIATMHGSLVQTNTIQNRILSFFEMFCSFGNYHDYTLELIKILILTLNKQDLEHYMRTYDSKGIGFNNNDILSILKCIDVVPIVHRRNMSLMLLTEYLGDYMNDSTFLQVSTSVTEHSIEWVQDDKRILNENSFIFNFYSGNSLRIEANHILNFIFNVIDKRLLRFTDNCFKLFDLIDFSQVSSDNQERIMYILIEFISKKLETNNWCLLDDTIISFALKTSIPYDRLVAALKEYHLDFYNTTFLLETEKGSYDKSMNHIIRYLSMADKCNETEGKNGVHIRSSIEPYNVINNILSNDNIELQNNDIDLIINSVITTLKSEEQNIPAKMSAANLLMFLYSRYNNYDWSIVNNILNENYDLLSTGYEATFDNETSQMLKFLVDLMLCCFESSVKENVIEEIFTVDLEDRLLLIHYLKAIENRLKYFKHIANDDEFSIALMHFCIIMSTHSDIDVKFYAIKCLIILTHYKACQKLVLKQLSKIMDNGSSKIRATIVSRVSEMSVDDNAYIEHILKKGKVDNSYLVRYSANRESLNFDNNE